MEKIIINPGNVRANGNIVDSKLVEYYYKSNCELTEGTATVNGVSMPILSEEYVEGSGVPNLVVATNQNSYYVGDTVSVTATLKDSEDNLIDGHIAFFVGDDCITGGTNTGDYVRYAETTNGVITFNYSFGTSGSYVIHAVTLANNTYTSVSVNKGISVSKKTVTISVTGLEDRSTYAANVPIDVLLKVNNVAFAGLDYLIFLDGVEVEYRASTVNGESYTLEIPAIGKHTVEVIFPADDMYTGVHETITFYDGKQPEINTSWTITSRDTSNRTVNGNFVVNLAFENSPINGMPVTIAVPMGGNTITIGPYDSDSTGKVTFPFINLPYGNYNISVTTAAYNGFTARSTSASIKAS